MKFIQLSNSSLKNIEHCLFALEEDKIGDILDNLSAFAQELSVF